MRRSPRVLLAWLLAALVALATARVVAGDLSALHSRARSLGPDVHVVLAARDLALGATITAADVHVVVRPVSTIAPDAVRDVSDAVGRVAAVSLLKDDLVRARAIAASDRAGIDGVVPRGKRGVHVVLKDGFEPPLGAVVDVLAAFDPSLGGAGRTPAAALVAAGARVIAVDGDHGSERAAAGVTLLVAEAEAPAVAYAATVGEVALALAPPESACCG